jgi:enoyl-CoA hydratase/carnithine racemase
MTSFDDYSHRYDFARFERRDGVVHMALHTDGASFVFSEAAHHSLGSAFADLADDPENRVVILSGTGERFCADFDYGSFARLISADPPTAWARIRADGRRMLQAFLDIEVPVISVVNGPALSHSELPLLGDVVLASENAVFQDATHFLESLPPSDGMHVVWTTLLGLNRGRYFLLTGQTIDAQEALTLGVVGEVLPPPRLLERAWQLAASWTRHTPLTLRGTRTTLTTEWRRLVNEQLHSGLTYEALAALDIGAIPVPDPPVIDLLGFDSKGRVR